MAILVKALLSKSADLHLYLRTHIKVEGENLTPQSSFPDLTHMLVSWAYKVCNTRSYPYITHAYSNKNELNLKNGARHHKR